MLTHTHIWVMGNHSKSKCPPRPSGQGGHNYLSAPDFQNSTMQQMEVHKPACMGLFEQTVLYLERAGIEIQNYYKKVDQVVIKMVV